MPAGISNNIIINDKEYRRCGNKLHEGNNILPMEEMKYFSIASNCFKFRKSCKECHKKFSKIRWKIIKIDSKLISARNLKRRTIKSEKRIKNGLAWSLWRSVKRNATYRNLTFSVRPEDIIIPDYCPVLNIPLIKDVEYLKKNNKITQLTVFNYPSVDRLDPTKGYDKNNINVISWRANNLKRDASLQEVKMLYDWMLKQETQNGS